tara:strand:+ start:3978 stop:4118 length:141 start_codon:yes stop_codon:yes gene_type:complete
MNDKSDFKDDRFENPNYNLDQNFEIEDIPSSFVRFSLEGEDCLSVL